MAGSESSEMKQLKEELEKIGMKLDDNTIQALINYGVGDLSDLLVFEDKDFDDLKTKQNLPEFKIKKLKMVKEKLKESQGSQDLDADFLAWLKNKGLSDATINALIKKGVRKKNNLKEMTDTEIDGLQLNSDEESVQRRTLKKIVEDLNKQGAAEQGGVQIDQLKWKMGDVGTEAVAGMVTVENQKEGKGGVHVGEAAVEMGHLKDKARVMMVDIKNLPPQPPDLDLATTDDVVSVMSDGPAGDFRVEHCTPEFHDRNKKMAYPMEKASRGKALIINVQDVENSTEPRDGTDVDRDKLQKLFILLHFEVTVFNDSDGLKGQEIKDKIQKFAEEANEESGEATVVCLLSHGEGECMYGTDGVTDGVLLKFDTVFGLFDDKNCPNLVGKPKMFFIQACRGVEPCLDVPSQEGGRSDMVVCYATQKGYKAFRETTNGSLFVDAIIRVFPLFAKQEDIIHMMYRVNYAVLRKLKVHKAENILPEIRLTLRRKLFFFPGIKM